MNCCICGKPVGQWGNNPFPLCAKDDYESRCCDLCNTFVVKGRMLQNGYGKQPIKIGDTVVVLYAKGSDSPKNIIAEQGKFLTGAVTSIDTKDKSTIYEGSWGSFVLDSETDQFLTV